MHVSNTRGDCSDYGGSRTTRLWRRLLLTGGSEGGGARDGDGGGVRSSGAEGGVRAGGPGGEFVAGGGGGGDEVFYAGAEGGGVATHGDVLSAVGGVVETDTSGVGI